MPDWSSLFSASAATWQFNIDEHLNRFVPPSFVPYCPRPLAHFLGHRPPPPSSYAVPLSSRKIGHLVVIAWAFVGVFCGVSVVNVVDAHIAAFRGIDGAATIIGSFGAAAVLEFYAIESPLAQPRNAVLGQVLSSIIGVAIGRLFSLAGPARFETLRWLAASLACAAATAVMALTGTVHPPAGATALIAVTDDNAYHIGWYLVPAVLLGSLLMQAIALVINNVQRRYPTYWWSPEEVGQFWRQTKSTGDVEDKAATDGSTLTSIGWHEHAPPNDNNTADDGAPNPEAGHVTFTRTSSSSMQLTAVGSHEHPHPRIIITRNAVEVPDSMYLRPEERLMLEALSERL